MVVIIRRRDSRSAKSPKASLKKSVTLQEPKGEEGRDTPVVRVEDDGKGMGSRQPSLKEHNAASPSPRRAPKHKLAPKQGRSTELEGSSEAEAAAEGREGQKRGGTPRASSASLGGTGSDREQEKSEGSVISQNGNGEEEGDDFDLAALISYAHKQSRGKRRASRWYSAGEDGGDSEGKPVKTRPSSAASDRHRRHSHSQRHGDDSRSHRSQREHHSHSRGRRSSVGEGHRLARTLSEGAAAKLVRRISAADDGILHKIRGVVEQEVTKRKRRWWHTPVRRNRGWLPRCVCMCLCVFVSMYTS